MEHISYPGRWLFAATFGLWKIFTLGGLVLGLAATVSVILAVALYIIWRKVDEIANKTMNLSAEMGKLKGTVDSLTGTTEDGRRA